MKLGSLGAFDKAVWAWPPVAAVNAGLMQIQLAEGTVLRCPEAAPAGAYVRPSTLATMFFDHRACVLVQPCFSFLRSVQQYSAPHSGHFLGEVADDFAIFILGERLKCFSPHIAERAIPQCELGGCFVAWKFRDTHSIILSHC